MAGRVQTGTLAWLASLVLAGVLAAVCGPSLVPVLAALPSATGQEPTMPKPWNTSAVAPQIDAAQPGQFKTATFAVG
jgi:hypothetical protein